MGRKSKFFTLVIVPSSYGKVRRIVIPKFVVTAAIIGLIICFFALFYFIGEYKIVKDKLTYLEDLEKLTQIQQKKIASLVEKVSQFNQTLNRLKEMEDRLKTMAGMGGGTTDVEEGLGKGGPDTYVPFGNPAPEKIINDPLQVIKTIEGNFETLKERARLQEENFSRIQEIIERKKALFSSTPNIFPVKGWISSGYGLRINPFTHKREMHEAIDIVASWGTPVKAACQGRVVYTGWKNFYGLVIRIENEYGYSTIYAHLSKILVRRGERVKKGQIIGRVGSSGRSTGPHLHFEVWKGKKTINPLSLMVEPLDLS